MDRKCDCILGQSLFAASRDVGLLAAHPLGHARDGERRTSVLTRTTEAKKARLFLGLCPRTGGIQSDVMTPGGTNDWYRQIQPPLSLPRLATLASSRSSSYSMRRRASSVILPSRNS